jgi:hypothetical protein
MIPFALPLSIIVAFIAVSVVKPKHSMLGVFVSRKFKAHNNKPSLHKAKNQISC